MLDFSLFKISLVFVGLFFVGFCCWVSCLTYFVVGLLLECGWVRLRCYLDFVV